MVPEAGAHDSRGDNAELSRGVILLFLALAAPAVCANASAELLPRLHEAGAAPQPLTGSIDISDSNLVSRTVTGVSLPLPVNAAGRSLGTVRLIGGVDTSTENGAAVGGLAWQTGGPDGLGTSLGVVRTGLPAVAGGGVLTQAGLRLPLPLLKKATSVGLTLGWYAGDDDQIGGAAGRLSFAAEVFGGRYSLSYAQAQSGFHPLGSQLTANQSNLDLSARYTLGRYQLYQRLRFRRVRAGQPSEIRTWRSDTFWGGPVGDLSPLITSFQLHAGLRSRHGLDRRRSDTGWLLEAQGEGISWQAWRFETRLAFEQTATRKSMRHATWRLGGARPIRLGAFAGNLATHLGVRLRTNTQTGWRLRSGVRLKMQNDARQLALDIHWVTDNGQNSTHAEPSWRVMFSYSIAATEALPSLAMAVGQLVPGT